MNSSYPPISVIICALNEEQNLPLVLARIPQWVNEVILVDGHSKDNTLQVARQVRPGIRILVQPGKGKGDAIVCGMQQATGDIVITLDADGSMDPAEISSFVEPLTNGYEFCKGSRFLPGGRSFDMGRRRYWGNKVFVTMTNVLYGCRYTDLAYGYNAFRRSAIPKLKLACTGFEIETEMGIKARLAHLKTVEVPSIEHARLSGRSNLNSMKDGWRILKTIIRERLH